jgi:hypothetical protein
VLASWGPGGVLLLAILDSGGIPLVGGVDGLVVFVSALDHSQAYWAAASAIAGSFIGSFFLYYLARKGGEAYLHRHTLSARGATPPRLVSGIWPANGFCPRVCPGNPAARENLHPIGRRPGSTSANLHLSPDSRQNPPLCVPGMVRNAPGRRYVTVSTPPPMGVHLVSSSVVRYSLLPNHRTSQSQIPRTKTRMTRCPLSCAQFDR